MITLLCIGMLAVLALYGRSVLSVTRHAFSELFRYLTLVLGLLFVAAMLLLLFQFA